MVSFCLFAMVSKGAASRLFPVVTVHRKTGFWVVHFQNKYPFLYCKLNFSLLKSISKEWPGLEMAESWGGVFPF